MVAIPTIKGHNLARIVKSDKRVMMQRVITKVTAHFELPQDERERLPLW